MTPAISTHVLIDKPDLIPRSAGVYLVTGRIPGVVAPRSGPNRIRLDDDLLYIGAGSNLRSRVETHLKDDSRGSSLRMSLGAALRVELDLAVSRHLNRPSFDFGATEHRLTEWIVENTAFTFWPTDFPFLVEKVLITNVGGTFNIQGRKGCDGAARLLKLREQAKASDLAYERLMRTMY